MSDPKSPASSSSQPLLPSEQQALETANSEVQEESETNCIGRIRRRFRAGAEKSTASPKTLRIKAALRRVIGQSESQYALSIKRETTPAAGNTIYDRARRHFLIGLHVLNVLTISILSIICYLLVKYLDGFSLQPDRAELSDYNVHLVCTVIGFVIAPVYAILVYRIFPHVKHGTLTAVHVVFLMFTSFLAIYGVKISYESHHVYGRVHLYSLHGWLGVTLTAILFFCIVSGNWIYLSTTHLPFMISCHKVVGMTMITIAIGAAISGILTRSQHLVRRFRLSTDSDRKLLPDRVIILNSLGMIITMFVILARWLLTEERFHRRHHQPRNTDQQGAVTGLLRYLATADDSVNLPDEERTWTEFVTDEPDVEPEEVTMRDPIP